MPTTLPVSATPSLGLNISTATTTQVIAAPSEAGAWIRILGINLKAAGTVNVTLKSGTNALTGPIPLTATQADFQPPAMGGGNPLYDCDKGAAFNITTDAAVQVSGSVQYAILGNKYTDNTSGVNSSSTKGTPYGIPSGITHTY